MSRHNFPNHKYHKSSKGQLMSCKLKVKHDAVLQYDVNAKYRLISRKFSGMKFFHLSVRLTNQTPSAFVSVL